MAEEQVPGDGDLVRAWEPCSSATARPSTHSPSVCSITARMCRTRSTKRSLSRSASSTNCGSSPPLAAEARGWSADEHLERLVLAEWVWAALSALPEPQRATCLVVSHRRAAVRRADQVIVLKDRRVERRAPWTSHSPPPRRCSVSGRATSAVIQLIARARQQRLAAEICPVRLGCSVARAIRGEARLIKRAKSLTVNPPAIVESGKRRACSRPAPGLCRGGSEQCTLRTDPSAGWHAGSAAPCTWPDLLRTALKLHLLAWRQRLYG